MAVAINEDMSVRLTGLQPLWHDKTPERLISLCPPNDPVAGWKTWQKHLLKRRKPKQLSFLTEHQAAILWGWPTDWERDAIQAAIASPTSLAEIVIGDDVAAAPDLSMSLQIVALAYSLPLLADELPAETWWFLLERLHTTALDAVVQRVDSTTHADNVLRNQLLAGELSLALSYLFPELRALRDLRDDARAALSESLVELTDGQGLPSADCCLCSVRSLAVGRGYDGLANT